MARWGVLTSAAFILALVFSASPVSAGGGGALFAGVGVADITPDLGRNFDGYVRPDIFSWGVASRLKARAVVLARQERKLALVSVDLMSPSGALQRAVAARLTDLGLDWRTVLLAATHTHAGPDLRILPCSISPDAPDPAAALRCAASQGGEDILAFLADRIALAVRRAASSLRPAAAGWARAELVGANLNRSIEAHLANHGLDLDPHTACPTSDPDGALHTIDPDLYVLRVDALRGRKREPMAALARFSAHNTAFPPANDVYSADWAGAAERRFEEALESRGHPGALALFFNGNEGDLINPPESYNGYAQADRQGRRLAEAMLKAFDQAGNALRTDVELDTRTAVVNLPGHAVGTHSLSPTGLFGLPFIGGAENGPSIFYQPIQTEGKRRPLDLSDDVNGRKLVAAPAPHPKAVPFSLFRVGEAVLATVPGEPTVELGRRIASAVVGAGTSQKGVRHVVVVGLAQEYTGYFTTPEEHDQQHYEGGHTVWGKWQGELTVRVFSDLAERLLSGLPDPPPEAELSAPSLGPAPALTGDGGAPGEVAAEPPEEVERLEVVRFSWKGGAGGKDRPLDSPFVSLERLAGEAPKPAVTRELPVTGYGLLALYLLILAGALAYRRWRRALLALALLASASLGPKHPARADAWVEAANDLGLGFVWRFDPSSSTYTASFDIPQDFPTGTYRFKVTSASYTLHSRPFRVAGSKALVVRGVVAEEGGALLRFHAALPAPDPAVNLLDRPVEPRGGVLRFRLGNLEGIARYDPATRTYEARLPRRVAAGEEVVIPEGGLEDEWGNRSGAERILRVGEVEKLSWPPPMPVGGWCVPGVGGSGCFYPEGLFPWPPGPPCQWSPPTPG